MFKTTCCVPEAEIQYLIDNGYTIEIMDDSRTGNVNVRVKKGDKEICKCINRYSLDSHGIKLMQHIDFLVAIIDTK